MQDFSALFVQTIRVSGVEKQQFVAFKTKRLLTEAFLSVHVVKLRLDLHNMTCGTDVFFAHSLHQQNWKDQDKFNSNSKVNNSVASEQSAWALKSFQEKNSLAVKVKLTC